MPPQKPKTPEQPPEMWIEYQRLDVLKRAPRNPQGHDLPEIENAIRRFGFIDPAVIDEPTGAIVAGHGRLDTLLAAMAREEEPPKRIRVDEDGMWLMPVLRGISFENPAEAEAYLMAANRVGVLGVNDDQMTAEILSDLRDSGAGLVGTGFDEPFLDDLLANLEPPDTTSPPSPGQRISVCEPGDVWLLGTHALTVGEKADQADLICEQFQRNTQIIPTRDGEEHSFIFED